ncbi:hypothetical protein WA026_005460 [Henosepilachna vigintioctopunctata]|uniref:Uncharacterized protein n=1 Tax=Henosepilachna vigintioctopunctata TaxID=420089 RepID=A0AAW1TSY2_9CUCU
MTRVPTYTIDLTTPLLERSTRRRTLQNMPGENSNIQEEDRGQAVAETGNWAIKVPEKRKQNVNQADPGTDEGRRGRIYVEVIKG